MPELVGIENLKKLVLLGAEGVNVGHKVVKGGGLLSLADLIDEISAVKGISKDAVVAEVRDLSSSERKELNLMFKQKLVLDDKRLENKIESGVDIVEQAIDLAYEVIDGGKDLAGKVKVLIES